MKIIYHNRNKVTPEPDFPAEYMSSLDVLLAKSDFVSLHMPLNAKTQNFFGAEQFAKMKDGSILINTARGGVVDQEALIKALDSGKVRVSSLSWRLELIRRRPSFTLPVWTSSPTSEWGWEGKYLVLLANCASLRPEIDERLRNNPKITILPHVGTHTYESRYEMEMLVLNVRWESIRAFLRTDEADV